jgi:hypothetical protein
MDELIARVSAALGVEAELAKTAIGHVLAFLQKELPEGPVAGGDEGGMGGLLGGLMGGGLMGLAGKLNGLGLDMGQIHKLGHEIFGYAETIVGKEKVQQIANAIPGLSQFM